MPGMLKPPMSILSASIMEAPEFLLASRTLKSSINSWIYWQDCVTEVSIFIAAASEYSPKNCASYAYEVVMGVELTI